MSLFPAPQSFSGIDFSENSIHAAVLRKTRKGIELVHLKTFSPHEPVNLLDASTLITALPSRSTLVRSCELRIKREKDLKAALDFQIEPLLPYSADKAIIQSQLVEKKVDSSRLTAFAARLDHIKTHLEKLHQKGVEPEQITCVPYALAALSTLFHQTASAQFIVHLGEKEVTCVLVEKGKLLASRAFDRKRDLGIEVQKTILSFSSSHKTKEFEAIILLGKGSEEIQKATGKTVLFPSTSAFPLTQEELIRYGLAIGIALAGDGINFRQKSLVYPHRWRRIKKPLAGCITLSLLLVGTLFGLGKIAIKEQKESIQKAYLSLFETEAEPVETLPTTSDEYLVSLHELEKKVLARPDTFPLLPGIPTVRELLTWFSTQPAIEIKSLDYNMVKRPDFSHKKEHYKVKIELEFSAEDARAANGFHELLVSPNPFVDPQEEIKWIAGKGKYRTTFYLKDKTRYT